MVRKGYLEAGRADDSLDLELGASASGVQGRKILENSSRQNSSRRGSGIFIDIFYGIHTEQSKNWAFTTNSDWTQCPEPNYEFWKDYLNSRYQTFKLSGCNDIGIWKFEFVSRSL